MTANACQDFFRTVYGLRSDLFERRTMIGPIHRIGVGICLLLAGAARADEQPMVIDVWPGEVAGDHGQIGPERIRSVDDAPTADAQWITNVSRPTISVFRPPADRNRRVAVIICPGGGYWNLAWDKEGEEVAAWLNSIGITGVVLKYRVPRRPGEPEPLPAPGPLLDAQRAIRFVRSQAAAWEIDPERIGIMGFSAGGHLAVMTAISFERPAYAPIDEVDQVSCRPNFAIVAYPGYILTRPDGDELADYIRIPSGTGPMFLVHATDDEEPGAPPEQSAALYLALRRAGVAAELHIFAAGRHGFGVRQSDLPVAQWTQRCEEWMVQQGILSAAALAISGEGISALPYGNAGLAARYPGDHAIESDRDVLFHDDFEQGVPTDRWDLVYHAQNIRLAEGPADVHSGAKSLEFRVPQQMDEVSNELIKRLGTGHDRVFLRYYSKFDAGFDQLGSSHNGSMLAAIDPTLPLATPGVKADGRNKFTASFENWRDEIATASPGPLNVYCYHPHQRSDYGDHFFPTGTVLPYSQQPHDFGDAFVSRNEVTPALGRWYCYELMLQANTIGRSDGRIACWVDGSLIADFPNLRLRETEILKVSYAGIGLHIKHNALRANTKWYDDVVIATSYIGPRVEPSTTTN
jgi:acetyl esterase/lipase